MPDAADPARPNHTDPTVPAVADAPSRDDTRHQLQRLADRIEALERRLERLEQAHGPVSAPPRRPATAEAPAQAPLPPRAPVPPATALPPLRPPPVPAELLIAARAPLPPPAVPRVAPPSPPQVPARSLETLIGQNWASWVGAIVLFLGIVFFLKYAWDQGWIRPSPAARVAAAVSCGALLAAVGEWLHWRRMRALAGTLWGAGVSVVIASFFGAHAYFDPPVMSANAAFGAVALTAAVSVLAALHVNVSIVAILGLIGAYLAPNLLTGAQDRSGFFMGYLAVLGLVAVGLGQLRLRWVLLRWVALVGSYLWLVIWWNAAGRSNAYHALAMTAAIGFAGLFVLEAAMALSRAGAADDSWAGAPSAEFFGIRIDTGPIEAHVIVASMLAIVGSMLHLLWTWNGAAATHIALAATVMAALLAGPGLVLNYLRPMWAAVRWVVLLISYGWLALWWQDAGRALGQESLAILWALGLYALFLLESVLALRRWSGKILVEAPEPAPPRLLDAQVAAASLLATAGTMGLLLWVWGSTDPVLLGTIALVLAAVQAGAALLARSRDFYISSALQSAALVTLAAPLLLDEFAVTLAWMLLAAALALAAWQLNLPRARVWAAILLVLALGRLVLVDFRDPVLRAVQFHVFDQAVTRWLLAGWTIALLYHLLAWLRPGAGKWPALQQWIDQRIPPAVRPQPVVEPARAAPAVLDYASHALRAIAATGPQPGRYDRAGVLFAAVGTLLFAALTLSRWSGPPATLALILWLAGLLLLSRQGERIGYLAQTWVLGALISLRWLVFDNLIPLVQTWNSGGEVLAVLNVPALCGVLLAAAVVAGLRWAPPSPAWARAGEPDGDESIRNVLAVWAVVIVFALLNFETIRYIDTIAGLGDRAIVKQVALSVLWALVGFGAVIFGFHRQVAPVRWAALALLGITLAKILVVDMSEVRAIWRILSFVAVGALLLGVSFVYHKQVEARATR